MCFCIIDLEIPDSNILKKSAWPPRWQGDILQCHQQTLSLHIGKGQVDTPWKKQQQKKKYIKVH